jgi:hypothetical protein
MSSLHLLVIGLNRAAVAQLAPVVNRACAGTAVNVAQHKWPEGKKKVYIHGAGFLKKKGGGATHREDIVLRGFETAIN